MLDVVIVDDEPVAIRRLASLLKAFDDVHVVGSATSANQALELVARTSPDLVLLDIEMPGPGGMDLASRWRQLDVAPQIVFVTAFARFAIEAFGIGATDYLLKPVEPDRLRDAIVRAKAAVAARGMASKLQELEHIVRRLRDESRPARELPGLWLDSQRGRIRVRYGDILWLSAERDYVRIHLTERNYFMRGRFCDYAAELADHGFVQVHRSVIVQKSHISRVEFRGDRRHRITLSNGDSVHVSRQYAEVARSLTRR